MDDKTTKWSKIHVKSEPSKINGLPHLNDLHDNFIIKFYVLDRQGRRLHNALKPHDPPPLFCEFKDGDTLEASTKSDEKLSADSPIEFLDKEIESKLLKHGRPIPCQIALYGCTSWGKEPLQCAVADGTLGDENIRPFVSKFLGRNAVQRYPLKDMMKNPMARPSAQSNEDVDADDTEDVITSREHSELDFISPQLTSLRSQGHGLTLRQLVRLGYLEPLSIDNIGEQNQENGEGRDHCNQFAIEVMFDEMRTGLLANMPDIRASAPHGEGSTMFGATDDVPVDVRVDLINMLRIDLVDAYFEVDFDLTFSWLTRMAPFEVDEKLLYEKKLKNRETDSVFGTAATAQNDKNFDVSSANQKLWRPNWRFMNRVDDAIGDMEENIYISERQKLARDIKLSKEVIESYWPFGNPTREKTVHTSSAAQEKFTAEFLQDSGYTRKAPSKLTDLTNYSTIAKLKEKEKKSIAESYDMLTRRFSCSQEVMKDPASNQVTREASTVNTKTGSGNNAEDDGIDEVTEIVLKLTARGLRFSFELRTLENFPFDILSLPILVGFKAPMGIYQASIARLDPPSLLSLFKTEGRNNSQAESEDESNFSSFDEREGTQSLDASNKRVMQLSLRKSPPKSRLSSLKSALSSCFHFENQVSPGIESGSIDHRNHKTDFDMVMLLKQHSENELLRTLAVESLKSINIEQSIHDKYIAPILEKSMMTSRQLPSFRPVVDFIPLPGRMRLRVSNDYQHPGVAEHKLRSYKWGIEESYEQKSTNPKYDAFMQINVRAESIQELQHQWATPIMSIRVHVHRKSYQVLNYIYVPLFLMAFVSFNTVLVGYGMELVSAFGDRCSITLTLLLTVVATELPEHLKEVSQVKNLKRWAFQFIVFIIFKDICVTLIWWPTTYWHSSDLSELNPWIKSTGFQNGEWSLLDNFFGNTDYPWWHRIWFIDVIATVFCCVAWLHQVLILTVYPKSVKESQLAAFVRFEAERRDAALLAKGHYLRKYVVRRTAKFLHERWRVGWAQKFKKKFVAMRESMMHELPQKSAEEITNNAEEEEEEGNSNPFPIGKGITTIKERATSIWVQTEIKKGNLEIPPRWKEAESFQNPPEGSNPPSTRCYHEDGKARTKWRDPQTGKWYVDINQPLDQLPACAGIDNMNTAETVLQMLEASPHAPRAELANNLHRSWLASQGNYLPNDHKLRKPWSELPINEKNKNMVIVDAVIDMCSLAHQVHAMVSALFNKDQDGLVSAEEFIMEDMLRPHFRENVRVPVKKGDIVKVRDFCMNNETYHSAVVIGWYQHADWDHASNALNDKKKRNRFHISSPKDIFNTVKDTTPVGTKEAQAQVQNSKPNEADDGPVIFKKHVDTDNFFFNNGTVFLVRLIDPSSRMSFSRGKVVLPNPDKVHFELLNKGEIHAVPETAFYWRETHCNEFVRDMLEQSDWLFDADGSCAINDHRCVPLASTRKI